MLDSSSSYDRRQLSADPRALLVATAVTLIAVASLGWNGDPAATDAASALLIDGGRQPAVSTQATIATTAAPDDGAPTAQRLGYSALATTTTSVESETASSERPPDAQAPTTAPATTAATQPATPVEPTPRAKPTPKPQTTKAPPPTAAPTSPPTTATPTTAPATTTTPPAEVPEAESATPDSGSSDAPSADVAASSTPPSSAPATTAPPTTNAPTTTTAPPATAPQYAYDKHLDVISPDGLLRLRMCESTNNYHATNPSGKYRGAYQFDRTTWDSVARRHYPQLVGLDPASVRSEAQDAMTRALWSERGRSPWPECGRRV